MTPQAIIVPAPRRVTFQNVQHNADDAVSGLTYGQLIDAMEAGRRIADGEGYDRGERAGRGQGIATARQQQVAQNLAPHTKTHRKLNKQTGILFLGGVIATIGLGTAAINQVPTLVALTSCGVKAGTISNLDARAATLHDCRVAGHIAIAVTALTGVTAIATAVVAWCTYGVRST